MNIAAIVISYNSSSFLENNIRSLLAQSVPFQQIIVVDNASTDSSLTVLAGFEPAITVLALDYNAGYAAAVNMGINATTTDLVLVANADIILEPTFNAHVLERCLRDPEIGLLSPLILRFDRATVDSAGQACSRALYPQEIGYNQPRNQVDIHERPVFSVCGAATIFRRAALEILKMGSDYYDEDFFIFWEDFDIGWRAQLLGIKTIFFPDALVYHFRSATLERNFLSRFSLALARPAFIKYHLVKNRYLTLIKNFHFSRNYRHIPFVFLKDIPWVFLLTFSSPKIIIPLMKSFKLFKKAFIKRKEINKRRHNRH